MTRRPAPGTVTVAGGGWIASGPPGADRSPSPVFPAGLRIGDRVWFRHAKAGELAEHVEVLHALAGDALTGAFPIYRGEGRSFG